MDGGKQKTLFQTWGASVSDVKLKKTSGNRRAVTRKSKNTKSKIKKREVTSKYVSIPASWGEVSTSSGVQSGFEDEEDDDVLLVAVYEAENSLNSSSAGRSLPNVAATCQQSGASKNSQVVPIENLPGFDVSAGDVWIYPTNYPLRQYQFSIAQECLYKNTLVCLPTGLGKTFIAAVVMYNFYRWYPSGKVVFMAPTKPLVAQQIEACYKVMGIPQDHMAEMTGSTLAVNRKEIWSSKRVFFLTPQVMVNDLSRGACLATEVKCLVIDEAHKALGNHAYCQVVKEVTNYNQHFRVLALSATPGSDTKAVQQVISNLLIAHIELRSEDSSDIQPYSHQRQVEKFVVPLSDELKVIRNLYLQVLETFTSRLTRMNIMPRKDIPNLTKYQLILARDQFRKNPPSNIVGAQQGVVEGDFALCISLYHGYELLQQMGIRSLYMFLQGILDGSKGMTRARNELSRCEDFMDLYKQIEAMISHTSSFPASKSHLFSTVTGSSKEKTFVYSHPKLKKLEEVVIQHFQSWAGKQGQNTSENCNTVNTRVMIFSSFRDSVQEIADILSQHQPLIRVMTFVGHSSGKSVKGYTQKEQLEVVKRFREGGYNTIVSTCVGEEGLDIGEVDLIICFDAQKSPIRLVQRMGRTGRKRHGRIVILLTEGKEERTYNQSQSSKRSIYKAIMTNSSKGLHLCQHSPRMIPNGISPVVHKMFISCGTYETKEVSRSSSKGRKSSSSIFDSGGYPKGQVSKDNGFLTSEEFEVWTSKYRLNDDDDGVGDPKLPGSDFALFKDEQQCVEPEDSRVCELSLSEWRVWQNQPFPTHVIDHSVRCQHFISIMEMTDLLRQEEEDNCSYDLEMMAFLQREDTTENSSSASKNKKSQHIHKPAPSKQFTSSVTKNTAERSTRTFMCESDDEDIALFKPVKSKGNHVYSKLVLEAPEITEAQEHTNNLKCNKNLYTAHMMCNTDASFSQLSYNSQEAQSTEADMHFDCDKDVYNAKSLDKEIFMPVNVKSAPSSIPSVNAERNFSATMTKENTLLKNREQDAGESIPLTRRSSNYFMKPDSGYNSFTDEAKVDSCNMFYPPVTDEMLHSFAVQSPDYSTKNISLASIKMVLTHVKEFLEESPPLLETLTVLDEVEFCSKDQNEPDNFYSNLPVQNKQKSTDSILETHVESQYLIPKQKSLISQQIKKLHGLAISDEKAVLSPNWDDVFDGSEEELECEERQAAEEQNLPISPSPPQTIPKHCSAKSRQCVKLAHEKDDPDQSLDLFEDENSPDLDLPCLSECKNVLLDCCGSDIQESSEDPLQYCEKQLGSENNVADKKETVMLVSNEINESSCVQLCNSDEELPSPNKSVADYDCSCDLFSVNFDLGFSLPDYGNEALESDQSVSAEIETAVQSSEKQQDCKDVKLGASSFSTPVLEMKVNTRSASGNNTSPLSSGHPTPHNVFLSASVSTQSFSTSASKNFAFDKSTGKSSLKHRNENTPKSAVNSTKAQLVRTLAKSTTFHRPFSNNSISDEKMTSVVSSHSGEVSSSESEEEIVCRRQRRKVKNILESPEVENDIDFDSPIAAVRKRRQALNISQSSSDADFHDKLKEISKKDTEAKVTKMKKPKIGKSSHHLKRKEVAQAFFYEEAELSSEDADAVSSDETDDSEDECDTSLVNFLNDNIQPSQGLNDSEMHGIYLKSVQSPAAHGKFKMVYKKKNDLTVFSQISVQDETYMEDSFIVRGGEDEDDDSEDDIHVESCQEDSSDDEVIDLELQNHESFVGERKQYCTRRKLKLKLLESEQGLSKKAKGSRIIIPDDSSDEDTQVENREHCSTGMKESTQPCKQLQSISNLKKPNMVFSESTTMNMYVEQKRQNLRLNLKASVSDILDFHPDGSSGMKQSTSQSVTCRLKGQTDSIEQLPEKQYKKHSSDENIFTNVNPNITSNLLSEILPKESSYVQSDASFGIQEKASPLCVLVDSREISSGPEVASCLRVKYGIKTEIQSLCGCDYIVSNRMVVTRKLMSDFANSMNKNKFIEHIQQLQSMFERICIIVEKDRIKTGEMSRMVQRTKYYDSMLSALISAGIKILFSASQEETAGLLAELVNLEKRKNAAIVVPTEVKGVKQQALQFYLSIPNVSYITALNLCHRFSTVGQMINSSVDKISFCAQVSSQKAEEIYRYIHYAFDSQMLPARCIPGNRKCTL